MQESLLTGLRLGVMSALAISFIVAGATPVHADVPERERPGATPQLPGGEDDEDEPLPELRRSPSDPPMNIRRAPLPSQTTEERLQEARERVARAREQTAVEYVERMRLSVVDRAYMDALIGYTPPEFTNDMTWHGPDVSENPSWLDYRDRIVVVQSWSSADSAGRQAVLRASRIVDEFSELDVHLILVHTPEGLDNAEPFIRRVESSKVSVATDPSGEWCDMVGIYRNPVNFVVDRNGVVQYAGLTFDGAKQAIHALIDEPYDEHSAANPLPPLDERLNVEFPPATGNTGNTPNIQGRIGPDVYVQDWVTRSPSNVQSKLIKLEFWRTNCPHCIRVIPKLNEVAERYRHEFEIIAISHESPDAIERGLAQRNHPVDTIRYPIASDPQRRTSNAIGVRGVPHALIMSSDGIVRWQGHPAQLSDEQLEKLIRANNAMLAKLAGNGRRWQDS